MEKNKTFFEGGEANEWFRRNKEALESRNNDSTTDLLVDWLKPFATEISDVLEIGCGSAHRLKKMADSFSAKGFGVEPSYEAIEYIENNFPQIVAKKGFGDDVPYTHQSGVFSHKQNNSDVFVSSGLYSVVNKFQFSHSNFFFDKEINERVSLTLLYKEAQIFGET